MKRAERILQLLGPKVAIDLLRIHLIIMDPRDSGADKTVPGAAFGSVA